MKVKNFQALSGVKEWRWCEFFGSGSKKGGWSFCGECEILTHLFAVCSRLMELFDCVKEWCVRLGEGFVYFGPKYSVARRDHAVLLNFTFGQAKTAVWLSRRNKMEGSGITEPVLLLKVTLSVRLKWNLVISDLESFTKVWGIEECVCKVNEEGALQLNF